MQLDGNVSLITSGESTIKAVGKSKLVLSDFESRFKRLQHKKTSLISPLNRSRCWTSEVVPLKRFFFLKRSQRTEIDFFPSLFSLLSLSLSLKIPYPAGQTYEQSCRIYLPLLTELVGFPLLLCGGQGGYSFPLENQSSLRPKNLRITHNLAYSAYTKLLSLFRRFK